MMTWVTKMRKEGDQDSVIRTKHCHDQQKKLWMDLCVVFVQKCF